jgi:ATP-dependent RNA helicase RhlB
MKIDETSSEVEKTANENGELTSGKAIENGASGHQAPNDSDEVQTQGRFEGLEDLSEEDEGSGDEDESAAVAIKELPSVDSFDALELHPELVVGINKLGWKSPTPVQGMCLPLTTVGKDVAGFAQTGTGKTGVFLITIANTVKRALDNNHTKGPKAVIMVPTRELAVQIEADARPIFDHLGISSLAVYGGVDYDKQAGAIKAGVDVIVATPGRLKDYYQKKILNLKYCSQFVCDEADRMFDMGFVEDIEFFLEKLDDKVQKLLFSATTNEQVKELAFEYLDNPEYISVNPESMTPENIEQFAILCESTQKLQVLMGLLTEHNPKCSIIFTNTKLVAEWLQYKLTRNGIEAELITGDLPQRKRINLINRIKAGEIKALIATDVASRGLHISDISHVYNFDLPNEASNYVHRIGRTARAGATGKAFSLVCEDYGHNLQAIRDYLKDHADINVDWFDSKYLEVEDKAPNPYQDPEFKSNTLKSAPEPQRRRKGGGDRPQGDKKGKTQRSRPSQSPNGEQGQELSNRRGKGPRKNNRTKYDRDNVRDRNNRSQHKKRDNHKGSKRKPVSHTGTEIPAQTPKTFGGIVKKFVSLMFGRKSK